MSAHRDPWVILEVPRSADDAAIKKSYRRLARQYHPDRNAGDPEKAAMFQDIARAYESVKNEEGRGLWLAKHESVHAPGGAFNPLGEDFHNTFGHDPHFPAGGGGTDAGSNPAATTQDLATNVSITFRQAFEGESLNIKLEVDEACSTCGGSGAAPGHKPRMCMTCSGTGAHAVGHATAHCAICSGRGYVVQVPCQRCSNGLVHGERPFVLPIPPGVRDGQVLRLPGPIRGRIGSADVLVTVNVKPSNVFKRTLKEPSDLLVNVPISYSEACFGAAVRVPTPEKNISLRIPAGTQNDKAFRIPNKGMPQVGTNGARGDLYARVHVVIPKELSGPQKKLVQQLGHYDPDDLRAGLFAGLREG